MQWDDDMQIVSKGVYSWVRTENVCLLLAVLPCQLARAAHNSSLAGTLRHLPEQGAFLLRIRNVSRHRIGVCLYRWLYELRLFDAHERKLTDEKSYLAAASLKSPSQKDYVILAPQQSASLKLIPLVARKHGVLPSAPKKADCIERTGYQNWAQEKVPPAFRRAGVKLHFLRTTPSIAVD